MLPVDAVARKSIFPAYRHAAAPLASACSL
jgi:hypothetical protein